MKESESQLLLISPLADNPAESPCPVFESLLKHPLVEQPLPKDFRIDEEAKHLTELWETCDNFKHYFFNEFVHAGGSGMVFRVTPHNSTISQALKIARHKLYTLDPKKQEVAHTLSPVSPRELLALETISHPNVVRLYEAIENERGIIAISTTYVQNPQPLDQYLINTLAKHPDPTGKKGLHPFSPQRLDDACSFLVARCAEIASALAHMHNLRIFHLDIKPANILISKENLATLTDLGSCIHASDVEGKKDVRIHFTWTYAHPALTSIINDPASISGGGLKASARVNPRLGLDKYDLFAFGRTIQEALAILAEEFGERCFASYGFRFLHMISCLLLDEHNVPSLRDSRFSQKDGRRFVSDTAQNYPIDLFKVHKIQTADELVERLARFTRQYSWNELAPELDPWQPEIVNTGVGIPAPFTRRVAQVFNHPCARRLKSEFQLGWMREVYPGATHNRWSHTIGVFAAVVSYYNALLADPEVPTLRILLDPEDLSHTLIAAILHDIGQTDFAHDFEAACSDLYSHEAAINRLLNDNYWGKPTLRETIQQYWPKVDIQRVLSILSQSMDTNRPGARETTRRYRAVDGIAADILDGPIDADKFDYLLRDSLACGVPYGYGIDRQRFLQALSVNAKETAVGSRLALAYKAKGSPAIESLLIARYQMYGAVYWHHSFRCIHAMFSHAAAATFGQLKGGGRRRLRDSSVSSNIIADLFYHWVVCGKPLSLCLQLVRATPKEFSDQPPASLSNERALEFIWKFADDSIRLLVERIGRRELYKRVFEVKLGDLGVHGDYSAIRAEMLPDRRVRLAEELEERFLDSVRKAMSQRGPTESISEAEAKKRHDALRVKTVSHIVIDFPVRGISEEKNFPAEIGDPARKYLAGPVKPTGERRSVFHTVKQLQTQIASVRVFAAPELHELITRYLDPSDVQACVESVIRCLQIHR
ncbi:MAG TPA: protein kinase [Blastocatellia bacterium]|nr:protein kinase [Blastocatellia bacterium]